MSVRVDLRSLVLVEHQLMELAPDATTLLETRALRLCLLCALALKQSVQLAHLHERVLHSVEGMHRHRDCRESRESRDSRDKIVELVEIVEIR